MLAVEDRKQGCQVCATKVAQWLAKSSPKIAKCISLHLADKFSTEFAHLGVLEYQNCTNGGKKKIVTVATT